MNIRNKKGFVLALALYFVIISMITSVALYTYAFHVARESGIQDPASARSYYAAIAAARYASILLASPTTNLASNSLYVTSGGITTDAHNGEFVIMTILPGSPLGLDLNMPSNNSITIRIDEFNGTGETIAGVVWVNGTYKMTVTAPS